MHQIIFNIFNNLLSTGATDGRNWSIVSKQQHEQRTAIDQRNAFLVYMPSSISEATNCTVAWPQLTCVPIATRCTSALCKHQCGRDFCLETFLSKDHFIGDNARTLRGDFGVRKLEQFTNTNSFAEMFTCPCPTIPVFLVA